MERIVTIHEVYDKDTSEFKEKVRCPFCHRTVSASKLAPPYPDKHLVRTAWGCGGHIAVFRKEPEAEQ